ncbi:hypothetical protein KFL_000830370 [Klebsormidium nitens]|uniref:SPARK domain-containing protein n=1 Tax=Klebsormidium nitens TaxID=105231 RepID=A0A1Y1HSE9_KLENI|nr:hypothetical protein KFL_000830370 [Klebsormidium nitens]|eukprot:GAQ81555.1 hypothetical protein KFL_000830370 [Klebsormidium nitens]
MGPVLLVIIVFFSSLQSGGADYVETAPRSGAPLPPPILPGECPLIFSPADIQQAKQVCSSGSSACCGRLRALLFQGRVRYANSTGRLLLPQAAADACIQMIDSFVTTAKISVEISCDITSEVLSEDSGKACGNDLTTVYDFFSAANHTYPGYMVGSGCHGTTDCSVCNSLISDRIVSLGRGTGALLSTPACQGLAQVAMTAAAYPVIIANSMARCLHQVDIKPVTLAPKCTIWDWNTINFTSAVLSCGPQQIRADRCCNLILGMYGQAQATACASELKAQLAARGVNPAAPDKCLINPTLTLHGYGCYNYTTLLQRAPSRIYEQLETVCNPATSDCTQCKPTFFSVADELANTTSVQYLNLCMFSFGMQYYGGFPTLEEITPRLNCYYRFPPGLELGIAEPPSSKNHQQIALIAGLMAASALMLVAASAVALLLWKRRSLHNGDTKTLGRMSSLKERANERGLKKFSRRQLRQATGDFDESRVVGRGGSGKVYVGLLNGETVAIKEASFSSVKNGAKRFQAANVG